MKTKQNRIIPCLDVDRGRVVKGKQFKNIQDVANPVDLAKRYNEAGADELVFYDITATNEGRSIFLNVVKQVSEIISIPFTVGGGIRSLQDMEKVLEAGADKISINSAAIKNPDLIREGAKQFGKDRIVLSMDVKKIAQQKWQVFINSGRQATEFTAETWAKQGEEFGAGELVLNGISDDGVQQGYDLQLIESIRNTVSIPIIASGGAGVKEHFKTAFEHGADGALAASVFHSEDITIQELKAYLTKENIF